MKKFRELCEALEITTMVQTKRLRYPKQIKLSEEFLNSLKREIVKHQTIDESKELPIMNFKEKFLKAITFHLAEHCGHCGVPKKKMKKKVKR